MHQTLTETLKHMLDEDNEIVTSVGEDGSEELASKLPRNRRNLKDVEVEIHQGQLSPYIHIFSVWNNH